MKQTLKDINYLRFILAIVGIACVTLSPSTPTSKVQALGVAPPVLFFSDLESGPSSGWEGSPTKGAAVTVWGKNFGTSRGASFVTVNGAQLNDTSDFAEWGEVGPAKHLERITFWLNYTCSDGPGTITVTINGITSNPLPFTVREGNIFFIAKDGSDNNNGLFSSDRGNGDGPWSSIQKTNVEKNSALSPGDIVYVREGLYGGVDEQSRMIYLRDYEGVPERPFVMAGYPGEWPILGREGPSLGLYFYHMEGRDTKPIGHFGVHKMIWENETIAIHGGSFQNMRIVGNIFTNNLRPAASGILHGGDIWDVQVYGNVWKDTGHDNWKHAIYFSGEGWSWTQHGVSNIDIGWNEFDHYIGDDPNPAHGWGGGAVEIKSKDNPVPTHDVYVHDNLFHECTSNLIWVTENSHSVYIYNNLAWNNSHVATGSSRGGIVTTTRYTGAEPTIIVYNNTFYDIGSPSRDYNIGFINPRGSNTKVQSSNNIFYSINSEPYLVISDGASFTSTNDLYFGNGSPPSRSGVTVLNPITQDPLFINTTANDFHLQEGSPAIDAGSNVDLSVDIEGKSRPQGTQIDIGAFEFAGEAIPSPTFADVPFDHWAHDYIEALYQARYTTGCSTSPLMYCPERTLNRAEGAVFTVRGVHSADFTPPQPTEQVFADTLLTDWPVDWVTQLWEDGYTAGCGTDPLIFCPWQSYSRAEGAVFALRMKYGIDYVPPDPVGIFSDVSGEDWFIEWAEAAHNEGLIPACQEEPLQFCPDDPLDRAMAAYMTVQAKEIEVP